MKIFIIILVVGFLLVITGTLLKINGGSEYENPLIALGLLLELIGIIGIILKFAKNYTISKRK